MTKLFTVLFIATALSACTTQMTALAKPYPAVKPEEVVVLFDEKPKCNAKQIAFLNTTTAWSFSQDGALQSARGHAASVGADYLVINKTEPRSADGIDTVFHAVAYKCVKGVSHD